MTIVLTDGAYRFALDNKGVKTDKAPLAAGPKRDASSGMANVLNKTRTADACTLEPREAMNVARNEGASFNTLETSSVCICE
jgi:hypothetical protein